MHMRSSVMACLVYVANDVGEIDAEDLRDHLIWPVKNFIEGKDPFRELQEEIYLLRRVLLGPGKFVLQQEGRVLAWYKGRDPRLCKDLDAAIVYIMAKEMEGVSDG